MPSNTWEDLLNKVEAETGGFEILPAGDYDFVISHAEATKTKDGSKDMIKVRAKVVTGDKKNTIVFHNFTISPDSVAALGILFRQFNVLGLTRETFWNTNPAPATDFVPALLGKAFRGKVSVRTYNGKESNEITNFFSATATGRQAAAAVASGAPNDAPAPSVAPSDAPPPAPAPAAEAAPAAPPAPAAAPPAPSGSVPPPPPPPPSAF